MYHLFRIILLLQVKEFIPQFATIYSLLYRIRIRQYRCNRRVLISLLGAEQLQTAISPKNAIIDEPTFIYIFFKIIFLIEVFLFLSEFPVLLSLHLMRQNPLCFHSLQHPIGGQTPSGLQQNHLSTI